MKSIQLLIVCFLVIFCNSVQALSLEPVNINTPQLHRFVIAPSFAIGTPTDVMVQRVYNDIQKNEFMKTTMSPDQLKQMANEISLSLGINCIVRQLRWDFTITPSVGILNVIGVHADINGFNVDIKVGAVRLEQKIPALYETKQQCSRTGPRRYGIAGPRSLECYNYNVQRGLNDGEIKEVLSALNSKVSNAQALISI